MITSLKIRNFRNHKDTTLRFGKLTAIAGPNGVGKSNTLEALLDFSDRSEKPREFDKTKSNFSKAARRAHLLNVSNEDSKALTRDYELFKKFGSSEIFIALQQKKASMVSVPTPAYLELLKFMEDWSYLKPKTDNLSPSYSEAVNPRLESSGQQLASVITHMMTTDRKRFDEMQAAFREVIPNVLDIRSTREKVYRVRKKSVKIDDREIVYDEPDEVIGDSLRFDTMTAKDLRADQMSEGTLLVLVIITALFQTRNPRVLLIDDLESGLHPKAQEDIVGILRAIVRNRKNLQIVFTTHSPYILNGLEADEINILTPDDEGYCRANMLSEHPRAKEALKFMSPGELWSSEGEAWVLESLTA